MVPKENHCRTSLYAYDCVGIAFSLRGIAFYPGIPIWSRRSLGSDDFGPKSDDNRTILLIAYPHKIDLFSTRHKVDIYGNLVDD